MDFNQKLRQRRIKIELDKKHKKDRLFKHFKKHKEENKIEKNDAQQVSFNDLINKYSKSESNIEKFSGLVSEKEKENNNQKRELNTNTNNHHKKENFKKDNKDNKDKKEFKKNSNFNNNNQQNQRRKYNTQEEYFKNKKNTYKKLNQKYKNGQPILKNKIEFLYKKILDKKNLRK